MIGTIQKVLVEGLSVKRSNEIFGRADNNKIINFIGDRNLIGKFVNVRVDELRINTLHGTYLERDGISK